MFVCKGRVFFLIIVLLGAAGSGAVAAELTEAEALRRFSEDSPRAREVRSRVPVVRAETRAWNLLPNPTITGIRESVNRSSNEFFTVQQKVPLSGRRGLLRSAGNAAVGVAQEQSEHFLFQLRTDLRLAFYSLLAAQERREVLRNGLGELQEVVRILGERERQGEGSAFDRLRAERELAGTETELIRAGGQVTQAQARLAAFFRLGTEPDSLTASGQLMDQQQLPPIDQLLEQTLLNRSDYKAEQRRLERLQLELRAAERLRIPEPSVSAGMQTFRSAGFSDVGYTFAVSVPLPIFNRGQMEVARLQATAQRTESLLQGLRVEIEAGIQTAYSSAQFRHRMAEQHIGQVGAQTQQLASIAQLAYQEGELGILELLDAYRVGLLARLQSVELLEAARKADIELDRAVGQEVLP